MKLRPVNITASILLLVFSVIPLVAGVGYALLYSLGLTGALQNEFTWLNWQKVFNDGQTVISFLYSAALSLAAVIISVGLALWVTIKQRGLFTKGIFSYVIYLPLAFPAMVAAFFFFQFLSKAGILSRLFYNLNLTDSVGGFPDLINDRFGIGIIVTQVFLSCPFFILLLTNMYKTEKVDDYLLLAKSLGANARQATFRLAVPMLLHKGFPTIVLYFIFMFGAYEIPVLLGRSSPEMVSVLAVRKLQKFNLYDIPQGYAIAVLYTFFVLTLIALLFRNRKIAYDV